MRIIGLILVMIMLTNTLNDLIDDKKAQIREEKFEDKNIKRKLEEKTNYVTLVLNKDYNFKINNKSIIEKVIINNGEPENLEQEIQAKEGSEIQIHFNIPLSNCSNFLENINKTIKDKIVSVDLSKFDSSNLKIIREMFSKCSSLKSINFLNFNTSNIKSTSGVFIKCSSLKKLDLSNFNTSMVTDMSDLFYGCKSLEELNLSNFNTSLVTNMEYLFYECSSLK